jgi:hypothetical protein
VSVYRGTFVHAYYPDSDTHDYGVVVGTTPKALDLSNPEVSWTRRIVVAKHEVNLLSEAHWQVVDAELRRRKTEYEVAEEAGKTGSLIDYSRITIRLS